MAWNIVVTVSVAIALGSNAIAAEDPSYQKLVETLGSEDFVDRKAAANSLVAAAGEDLQKVVTLLTEVSQHSDQPEARFQSKRIIREIYQRYELGIGEADFGFKLGWFIEHNGKDLSALPMVLEVDANGPADKAGFKPGDIITHVNGEHFRDENARNKLVQRLASMPPNVVVVMKFRNSGAEGAFQKYHKHKTGERHITPTNRLQPNARDPKEGLTEKDFADWKNRIIAP